MLAHFGKARKYHPQLRRHATEKGRQPECNALQPNSHTQTNGHTQQAHTQRAHTVHTRTHNGHTQRAHTAGAHTPGPAAAPAAAPVHDRNERVQ